MRRARVLIHDLPAGVLTETDENRYIFEYDEGYKGPQVSLTFPIAERRFEFESFPPFFDGLLPEGPQLEALLRQAKLDRSDAFGQLVTVGHDLVGAVTVEMMPA
jgi:serine/threonine-protein kinase HipA